MKKLIYILPILLFLQPIFATNLILVQDGNWARCNSTHNVFHSNHAGAFRFSNPKIDKNSTELYLELDVKFLKCVNTNSDFNFQKRNNDNVVTYRIPTPKGIVKATREDKTKELLVTNENSKLIGRVLLKKVNGQYKASIKIKLKDISQNNFPNANKLVVTI